MECCEGAANLNELGVSASLYEFILKRLANSLICNRGPNHATFFMLHLNCSIKNVARGGGGYTESIENKHVACNNNFKLPMISFSISA